ncbi:hypothetical protein QYE76_021892 [Lolium multiflorum]|uniref:Transposon protein, putative, CACTA, En/Spm sub-class n=1 Tax=Lolium multiflorum TaxID=4521 RepID=A0AAD8R8T3_LOLMU|nr:hypothetical protein QYE76_021892 [Lolium multiflorum]
MEYSRLCRCGGDGHLEALTGDNIDLIAAHLDVTYTVRLAACSRELYDQISNDEGKMHHWDEPCLLMPPPAYWFDEPWFVATASRLHVTVYDLVPLDHPRRSVTLPFMHDRKWLGANGDWIAAADHRGCQWCLVNVYTERHIPLPSPPDPKIGHGVTYQPATKDWLYYLCWSRAINLLKIVICQVPTKGGRYADYKLIALFDKRIFYLEGGGDWRMLKNPTPEQIVPAFCDAIELGGQVFAVDEIRGWTYCWDTPNDGDSRMGEDEAEEEPIFDEPIFDDPDDDLGRAILDAKISCGSEKERLKLQKMLEDHKTLLYPNCEDGQKKLGTTLELLQWKAENGTSDKGFEKLLKIIKKMLPGENVLPSSTYEAKKVVCPLGLEVQKIHACINDCILYRGEYENLNACPVCSALRYKIRRDDPGDVEGESTPRKRVPAKRKFIMMPVLIQGPRQPGNDIDVYLRPLVEELLQLWRDEGVPVWDEHEQKEFNLRALLFVTINDWPALHNSILVAPYKEEHKDILRSKYPEEREDWIDGEHMKTFGGWLQTRLMNATDDEQLYLLAKQPSSTISTFQGYEINGNTFYTFAQDKKSTNQNSGVRFDAADDNGKKVTYYGYIEEIWELEYGPNFKVPLFRCKWFNLKDGVQVDPQYGMTTVDLKNLGYDTEPFVLASEVAQVFYVKDMSSKPKKRKERQEDTSYDEPKRHIVLSGKRNIVGVEDKTDMSEDYNKFDDIPPFKARRRFYFVFFLEQGVMRYMLYLIEQASLSCRQL